MRGAEWSGPGTGPGSGISESGPVAQRSSVKPPRDSSSANVRRLTGRGPVAAQARHWLTRVAADEYDRALAASPDVCRPLAAAMGDLRPAARLLADYPADRARTAAAVAACPEGARRLARLASAVAVRLASWP